MCACVCLRMRLYLLSLGLHLIQRWQVGKIFLQCLYALLFFLVLFALSLTLLFQTTDVAIPRLYLLIKNWFKMIMLNVIQKVPYCWKEGLFIKLGCLCRRKVQTFNYFLNWCYMARENWKKELTNKRSRWWCNASMSQKATWQPADIKRSRLTV